MDYSSRESVKGFASSHKRKNVTAINEVTKAKNNNVDEFFTSKIFRGYTRIPIRTTWTLLVTLTLFNAHDC